MRRLLNRVLWPTGYQLVSSASGLALALAPGKRLIYAVCHKADVFGMERLTPAQAVVAHAWAALGRMSNGGFRHYYECDWRMAEVAAALRTLGFEAGAAACERSLDAFPDRRPPADQGERWDLVRHVDWRAFDAEDWCVYETVEWDALERAILAHIEAHRDEFVEFR